MGPMSPMPTVMGHKFSQVPQAEIPRASFDRSHGHKTTFDAGKLIPIFVDEVLPGDTFNLNMSGFGRLATPLHPIMDNMFLETFFFFVPNRLVWDNWEKFNGEQTDPGDSTDYLIPTVGSGGLFPNEGSIWDHFGLPVGVDINQQFSALPFRAYNLIYNEWFRDQNLIDSLSVSRGDGPDLPSLYEIQRRGKRHDYFTSCLPWPQKGEAVSLPLSGNAPIATNATTDTHVSVFSSDLDNQATFDTDGLKLTISSNFGNETMKLYADLSEVTSSTINDLREAFQVQKLLERDARGGTRYTEIVQSHFGVTSPDARLQRPEYLGGGSTRLNISPVAQTSESGSTTPQGNLAALGTVGINSHGFTKSFTEHGHIIGLVCARADLTYQQGINRMWSRQGRFDYYWPALAHLGEQAVLNKEIYAQGTPADDEVFGYQERYAEYRYKPSQITGAFRSSAAQSLDTWHLSQDFASVPVLGKTFIEENPPVDRAIAVPSEPHLIFDSFFQLRCARPMPIYSVPGLIDHF
ncbi:MAG: major capsid protein [Microviridae sp.]|nr:MAG: major capsid protein [Microviridae sp.]